MFESGLNYLGVFMFMHVIALCIINGIPVNLPFAKDVEIHAEFGMHTNPKDCLNIANLAAIIHINH